MVECVAAGGGVVMRQNVNVQASVGSTARHSTTCATHDHMASASVSVTLCCVSRSLNVASMSLCPVPSSASHPASLPCFIQS